MAAVVIFDIHKPLLGERVIPVNTHEFELVEGIEVLSYASQHVTGVISVSFHSVDPNRETLWMRTWIKGGQKDVLFKAAGMEVRGVIQYKER